MSVVISDETFRTVRGRHYLVREGMARLQLSERLVSDGPDSSTHVLAATVFVSLNRAAPRPRTPVIGCEIIEPTVTDLLAIVRMIGNRSYYENVKLLLDDYEWIAGFAADSGPDTVFMFPAPVSPLPTATG